MGLCDLLEDDCQLAWQTFDSYVPESLKSDIYFEFSKCCYFKLQRLSMEGNQTPEFFVSQTRINQRPILPNMVRPSAAERAISLERAAEYKKIYGPFDFADWGFVAEDPDSTDVHRLFKDKSTEWHQKGTLHEVLSLDTAATDITIGERMHLAKLITVSFAQLLVDFRSQKLISLESFRYFTTKDQEISDGSSVITELDPYLLCGIGKPPPKTSIIGGQKSQAVNSIMQLGILLIEVGLCIARPNHKQKSTQVREWATEKLDVVKHKFPAPFGEIVGDCLQHQTSPTVGQEDDEIDFLIDKMIKLQDILKELETRPNASEAVPQPVRPPQVATDAPKSTLQAASGVAQ